jgi:hypothetical protein
MRSIYQDGDNDHQNEDDNDDDDTCGMHREMTMEEFLTLADDEGECLNLLDLPNYQPDVPIFVR